MPDNALRHADAPAPTSTADTAKQPPGRYAGCDDPQINRGLDPIGHRDCSDMPILPNKINDRPMFIAPLQMGELQIGQFPPRQPAAKQDRKNRPISSALDRVRRRSLPESTGLFSRQPVAQSDAQFSNAFHAPNAGRQLRAQQASVGGFLSEPSHGRQPSVDRSCRELAILEENAITGDHNLVERQAWLGAVPLNEFIDRVSISALRLGRAKAIQDRRFAVVQIREAELCFWPLWLRGFPLGVSAHSSRLHRGWPRAYACTQMRLSLYDQVVV